MGFFLNLPYAVKCRDWTKEQSQTRSWVILSSHIWHAHIKEITPCTCGPSRNFYYLHASISHFFSHFLFIFSSFIFSWFLSFFFIFYISFSLYSLFFSFLSFLRTVEFTPEGSVVWRKYRHVYKCVKLNVNWSKVNTPMLCRRDQSKNIFQ